MGLQAYKVSITTKAPVFVGSGKEYKKFEYLMLPKNFIGIIDMPKLYQLTYAKKIAPQFEDFMLGKKFANGKPLRDLKRWLDSVNLTQEAMDACIKYKFSLGDIADIPGKPMTIMSCVKDAYDSPYIPGSSLKGVIRTILAAYFISEDRSLREFIKKDLLENLNPPANNRRPNKKAYLSSVIRRAEEKIFRTLKRPDTKPGDAVNDIMQGFIVGDSAPIDANSLTLAQKIDRKPDGKENALNILCESIRPETVIEFPITIDDAVFPLSEGELLDAVYNFVDIYNEHFLSKFKGTDIIREDIPHIFLGGGAGFASKTLIYSVMGITGTDATMKIFDNTGVPRIHKHINDKKLGVSPHIVKCTRYQGKTLQMGLCEFSIEKV